MAKRDKQNDGAPVEIPEALPETPATAAAPTDAELAEKYRSQLAARLAGRKAKGGERVRPLFLLLANDEDMGTWRILGVRQTIGQARKALPDARQNIARGETGPFIVRGKLVN
jgi:hypothetical protein